MATNGLLCSSLKARRLFVANWLAGWLTGGRRRQTAIKEPSQWKLREDQDLHLPPAICCIVCHRAREKDLDTFRNELQRPGTNCFPKVDARKSPRFGNNTIQLDNNNS